MVSDGDLVRLLKDDVLFVEWRSGMSNFLGLVTSSEAVSRRVFSESR